MKSTSVAIGCLTGLASATYNHPRHFHAPRHYAVNNITATTSSAAAEGGQPGPQTTLTVAVTNLHTVVSCAPTVTNCPAANNTAALSTMPASELATGVVTEVVDLTTTVCPVTEAESVSKSVVEAHSSGYIVGTTRPAPGGPVPTVSATATAPGAVETGKPATSMSATVGTTDKVLTMTVGPSGSESVVTTTIRSTFTNMVTVTMTAPGAKETSENSPNKGGNQPGYPVNTPPAPVNEGTTTTTSTSTGTRTVTVDRPSTATETGSLPTGEASTPGGTTNPGSGKDNGSGNGDCQCPAPATVTVTAAAQTVYVTAPAAAATESASSPAGGNSGSGSGSYPVADKPKSGSDNSAVGSDQPATGSDKPATGSDQPATGSDKPATGSDKPATGSEPTPAKDTPAGEGAEEDDCPPEDEPVIATKVQTVVPYPTGASNATQPKGAAAPTGYPTSGHAKLR